MEGNFKLIGHICKNALYWDYIDWKYIFIFKVFNTELFTSTLLLLDLLKYDLGGSLSLQTFDNDEYYLKALYQNEQSSFLN